jgi:hypothetical protein
LQDGVQVQSPATQANPEEQTPQLPPQPSSPQVWPKQSATQTVPESTVAAGDWQVAEEQVNAEAVQSVQAPPPVPQTGSLPPGWQIPFRSQQPEQY